MKKIIQWLSGGVIKEIGNVIDKLTTTDEERLEVKKQIQQILEDADTKAQLEVSKRWEADMKSDSFLSKNIRPFILIYLTVIFTSLAFFDALPDSPCIYCTPSITTLSVKFHPLTFKTSAYSFIHCLGIPPLNALRLISLS